MSNGAVPEEARVYPAPKVIKAVIGSYADYFDTGMWSMKGGEIVAPDDLTVSQLKDFLTASGGAVYLNQDRKLAWAPGRRRKSILQTLVSKLHRKLS